MHLNITSESQEEANEGGIFDREEEKKKKKKVGEIKHEHGYLIQEIKNENCVKKKWKMRKWKMEDEV